MYNPHGYSPQILVLLPIVYPNTDFYNQSLISGCEMHRQERLISIYCALF